MLTLIVLNNPNNPSMRGKAHAARALITLVYLSPKRHHPIYLSPQRHHPIYLSPQRHHPIIPISSAPPPYIPISSAPPPYYTYRHQPSIPISSAPPPYYTYRHQPRIPISTQWFTYLLSAPPGEANAVCGLHIPMIIMIVKTV
jgi:hypothetical protein